MHIHHQIKQWKSAEIKTKQLSKYAFGTSKHVNTYDVMAPSDHKTIDLDICFIRSLK